MPNSEIWERSNNCRSMRAVLLPVPCRCRGLLVSPTLEDLPLETLVSDFEDCDAAELCELAALVCATPIAGAHLLTPEGFTQTAWHGAPPPGERLSEQTPCALVLTT